MSDILEKCFAFDNPQESVSSLCLDCYSVNVNLLVCSDPHMCWEFQVNYCAV